MRKYKTAAITAYGEYFVYRLNFILWRVRNILSVLTTFFLWHAVFLGRTGIFNYQRDQMLTYMLMILFTAAVVLSTRAYKIAEDINTGNLKTFLLQPASYLGLTAAREVTDKLINIVFSLFEFGLLLFLLRPVIIFPQSIGTIVLYLLALFLGAVIYFAFGIILSCLGFWSREVWAPRFLFYIVVTFLSGMYFPLDIVEGPIRTMLSILPFGYLVYFPISIFLERLPFTQLLNGFTIAVFWVIALLLLSKHLWRKGLRTYTAEGS